MEFIGDSFLKLATTRKLYDDMSIDTPGKLSGRRSHFVCNAHLARISSLLSLGEYMNVLPMEKKENTIYPFFTSNVSQSPANFDQASPGRFKSVLFQISK